jgi:hypothetical protein
MAMTNVVVAGSNNDNSFAVIDVSSPVSPAKALVTPPFQGGCMVDAVGSLAVAANYNGGQVAVYDVSNPASPVFPGAARGLYLHVGLRTPYCGVRSGPPPGCGRMP